MFLLFQDSALSAHSNSTTTTSKPTALEADCLTMSDAADRGDFAALLIKEG